MLIQNKKHAGQTLVFYGHDSDDGLTGAMPVTGSSDGVFDVPDYIAKHYLLSGQWINVTSYRLTPGDLTNASGRTDITERVSAPEPVSAVVPVPFAERQREPHIPLPGIDDRVSRTRELAVSLGWKETMNCTPAGFVRSWLKDK